MDDIFSNEAIEFERVDFSTWLTEDGEEILIEDMSDEAVRNQYISLKRKLKLLPEHVNADIWEAYKDVFEEECKDRNIDRI